MRGIVTIIAVALILSFVTLATADLGSCTCLCQVGQNSNNGTVGQIFDLGDVEVEACKECNTNLCLESYPSECQGFMYAQCDFSSESRGSILAQSAVGSAVVAFLALSLAYINM
jgi:hypothetical protein